MKVKIQHPGLPDGYGITLTGLNAILLNNEEVDVDDEAIAQYEEVTGRDFNEVINGPVFGGEIPVEEKEKETEAETEEVSVVEEDVNANTFTGHDGVEV